MNSEKILDMLCVYVKTGARPPPDMSAHIIKQLPNIDPTLHETHYILADELAKLPEENCPYARDIYMRLVLERLCAQMSLVKHPSIEQMLPILQVKLKIVCKNIKDHNESVFDLLKAFVNFTNAFVNEYKFDTKEILSVAKSNSDFFAIILRPVIQFTVDTLSSATDNPCVVERLHFAMDAVHKMITLMSDINHIVVVRIFSEFEIYQRYHREAMVLLTENFTKMLSNLGNYLISYVVGRPFDTVFLNRIRAYFNSKYCPISWRPLVQTVIEIIQGLPAMICWECRFEHVVQKVNVMTLLVEDMARPIPNAIFALEEIISSLELQRSQHRFKLLISIMIMRRILQHVNQH
jgi:hypothetical protein